MFVTPVNMFNYSGSRKNNSINNYQTNMLNKNNSDKVSFTASFKHFEMISVGVEDFSRVLVDTFDNISFNEAHAGVFDALYANVMKVVDSLKKGQPEGDSIMQISFPHDRTKNNDIMSAVYSLKNGSLSLKIVSPETGKVVNPEVIFDNGKLSSITWLDNLDPKYKYKRTLNFEEKDGKTVLKKPVKAEFKP